MTGAAKGTDHPQAVEGNCPVAPVYLLFFLSGAAALVYEVSWARQVGLLIGHTAHAAAVVLTAYFAGLAAGYAVGGRLAGKVKPLAAYAVAELAAAGWACLIPSLLSAAASSGAAILHSPSPVGPLALRWLFCFLLLLPATAALGATLPLIADWLSPAGRPAVGRVTTAYAFNTAGAFAGTVAATAWLLVNVGVNASGFLAAGLSAFCGAAAVVLHRLDRPQPASGPVAVSEGAAATDLAWPLVAAGLSGFGILALEVLYTRLFSLVFHNSTYTFGAVLAAVVLALALGPVLARLGSRKMSPRSLLAWAAGAGAGLTLLSVYLFVGVTRLEYFRLGDRFAVYLAGVFGLVVLVVLPPVAALGMILPAVWYGQPHHARGMGPLVGRTAVVNTLAGAAGAACASLALLPGLGLWGSFGAVALSFALLAVVTFTALRRRGVAALSGLVFLALAAPLVSPPGPERWAAGPAGEIVVRRWNTAYGWIDVVEGGGVRKVRQNLHYRFGGTGPDAPRAYRQAHLPLLLHPRPSDVLFLGLGTGLTAGGAVAHAEVERAVVVELIPEVVEAARLLADANFGVVDHPKVDVKIDDARHYLLATDRRFDVIVSDLFVPWESETGYLYTVEHYRAARRRLRPGGLFCQWLAVYQLGSSELEMIADSFASVFPETSLWWGHISARRPIVALVGSDGPLPLNERDIDDRLSRIYETAPTDEEIRTARDLMGLYLGHWQARRPDRLNTDELPRVEFSSPVSQADRALLQGDALRRYYDAVLARLPDRGGPSPAPRDGADVRRAWHRITMFPE